MKELLIAACIIVAIIIVYICARWHTLTNEEYMYGFWVADDEFCEESEIDSMLVFIGEPDKANGVMGSGLGARTRTCYIVIMNGMSNQGFTIKYSPSCAMTLGTYSLEAVPEFDDEAIWPGVVTIDVNILKGTMLIHSKDENSGTPMMWARLNKQHDITNLARSLEGAEFVDPVA